MLAKGCAEERVAISDIAKDPSSFLTRLNMKLQLTKNVLCCLQGSSIIKISVQT